MRRHQKTLAYFRCWRISRLLLGRVHYIMPYFLAYLRDSEIDSKSNNLKMKKMHRCSIALICRLYPYITTTVRIRSYNASKSVSLNPSQTTNIQFNDYCNSDRLTLFVSVCKGTHLSVLNFLLRRPVRISQLIRWDKIKKTSIRLCQHKYTNKLNGIVRLVCIVTQEELDHSHFRPIHQW